MFKALIEVFTPERVLLYIDGEVCHTKGHAKDWINQQLALLPILGTDTTETSITRIPT
jgi:hypothetical protein